MKNRTLNELYKILLESINKDGFSRRFGVCAMIMYLHTKNIITDREHYKLIKYFKSQKPRKIFFGLIGVNENFINNESFIGSDFWWYKNDKGNEQRKLFIEHLINKTKPKLLIDIKQEYSIVYDNHKCDFKVINETKDPNIDTSEYINKPCPKCGENLLTQKDNDVYITFMNYVVLGIERI